MHEPWLLPTHHPQLPTCRAGMVVGGMEWGQVSTTGTVEKEMCLQQGSPRVLQALREVFREPIRSETGPGGSRGGC